LGGGGLGVALAFHILPSTIFSLPMGGFRCPAVIFAYPCFVWTA
jgi:hypothetical protein